MEEQRTPPSTVHNDRMRGGGHKLQHGKFQFDVRKNIFTIVKQWNKFPREVVASPPLKTQSGKVLSNLFKLVLL